MITYEGCCSASEPSLLCEECLAKYHQGVKPTENKEKKMDTNMVLGLSTEVTNAENLVTQVPDPECCDSTKSLCNYCMEKVQDALRITQPEIPTFNKEEILGPAPELKFEDERTQEQKDEDAVKDENLIRLNVNNSEGFESTDILGLPQLNF